MLKFDLTFIFPILFLCSKFNMVWLKLQQSVHKKFFQEIISFFRRVVICGTFTKLATKSVSREDD